RTTDYILIARAPRPGCRGAPLAILSIPLLYHFQRRLLYAKRSARGETERRAPEGNMPIKSSGARWIAMAALPVGTFTAPVFAKDTVKIAFIGPLTGGNSALGIGGRNSADLAVRLRNAEPKSRYRYELVALDDECKPDTGVQVATKAGADKSIVAGVTHYCSVVAVATVDTYHN